MPLIRKFVGLQAASPTRVEPICLQQPEDKNHHERRQRPAKQSKMGSVAEESSIPGHINSQPSAPATAPAAVEAKKMDDVATPVKPVASRDSVTASKQSRRFSSRHMSLSAIAAKCTSRSGMASTIVYVLCATMLAVSTYGLDTMANNPINLGIIESKWFSNIFDVPINTFLQGSTSIQKMTDDGLMQAPTTSGTHSLSDLQYDTCGVRDSACAETVRPNTERVLYSLASSFSSISGFDVPEVAASPEKIKLSYANTLSGFNFPVVQFYIPGNDWAVVCSVRRNLYRVAQEAESSGEIDSLAICSKRKYDANWICENEVEPEVMSYIIKINLGKVTYLGAALRKEMYFNPGNIAKLSGSAQGTGFLSTVIAIDEYNGGIIQSSAPWDMVPAYLCQGTFNIDTYAGMRWQGQGVASMTWRSSSLMVTNSVVLWAATMSLAVIQFMYLPKSSVCVVPVNMAKTAIGPVILGFACYSNYNVQVLTTYLNLNKVTSFDVTPYRLCGPVMFSSVIALMSGTAIQMFFNPLLVSPSYVLTIVSIVNWIIVFVLETAVFPKASSNISRPCGMPSSTTCSYYSATVNNYFLSPIIAACAVGVGILVTFWIQRRAGKMSDLPSTNSVLKLLNSKTVRQLATSGAGGCVVTASPDGKPLVDAGILLNKNLIRISSTSIVRSCMVKYVMLYRFLPPVFARQLSRAVGVTLVIKAKDDHVVREVLFLELQDMKIGESKFLPAYYS